MRVLICAVLLLFSVSLVNAETILIVNNANKAASVTSAEAANFYLGKVTQWPGGVKVMPVDQKKTTPAGTGFLSKIMKMSEAEFKKIWVEKMLSGEADPPPVKNSDAEVVEYVKANPGAIGYIDSASPHEGVKVLPVSSK